MQEKSEKIVGALAQFKKKLYLCSENEMYAIFDKRRI